MLQEWLTEQVGVNYDYIEYFELYENKVLCDFIDLDLNKNECAKIINFLRDLLINSRIDENILNSCISELEWNAGPKTILSIIVPSNDNMMSAEFGEVLTEAILEKIHKYKIPIKKRRYAIQGNQSLPSHDTLALKVKKRKVVELCYIESKLRNVKDYGAPTEAFSGLKEKYLIDLPEYLIFNLQRMDELKHPLHAAFKEYLKNRAKGKNNDTFWIGLTWDIDNWDESMLNKLKTIGSNDMPKTRVHLVKVKDLKKLIHHLFAQVRSKYE